MDKRLVATLVAIGTLLLLLFVLQRGENSHAIRLPQLSAWTGPADAIVMGDRSGEMRLFRDASGWQLEGSGARPDGMRVAKLETRLRDMVITDVVTYEPVYGAYGLSPGTCTRVLVRKGDRTVRDLCVGGASASTYRHVHVRLRGEPGVYRAAGRLDRFLQTTMGELRGRPSRTGPTDAGRAHHGEP